MKNICGLLLLSILAVSCVPEIPEAQVQPQEAEVVDSTINTTPTTGDNSNTGNESHDNDTGNQAPTNLPVDIIVSESNVIAELAQVKMIPITIKAGQYFEAANIEVNVDYSSLLDFNINAGNYITTTLNQSNINLNTNGQVGLVLTIDVKSMAPSFKSANNGGTGKLIIRASANQGGALMEKEFQINFEVKPQLTVGIISDSVPHGYDQPNQIYTRSHTDGLQIVFQNKTMNFGLNGNGPCIHTTSPLQHCSTANRMEPGEQYLPPKVFPGLGYRKAIFYNHFNSSDNISRFIHFNVAPGNEDA